MSSRRLNARDSGSTGKYPLISESHSHRQPSKQQLERIGSAEQKKRKAAIFAETVRKDPVLPSMNHLILTETIQDSPIFFPKKPETTEQQESQTAASQAVWKRFMKNNSSDSSSQRRILLKKPKDRKQADIVTIQDPQQASQEDKNLKPFALIDSYYETRSRFTTPQTSKHSSVDLIYKKLRHNSKEKTKYLSFFENIKKKKIDSVVSEVKKWNEKIHRMPRLTVRPKAARPGDDSGPGEDRPAEPLSLMTNPTKGSNDVVSKIMVHSRTTSNPASEAAAGGYDLNKITARWIAPSQFNDHAVYAESREGGSMVAVGGTLWIFGGYNNRPVPGVVCFDTAKNRFFRPPLKDDYDLGLRFNHSAVVYREQIVVFGGECMGIGSVFASKMTTNSVRVLDTGRPGSPSRVHREVAELQRQAHPRAQEPRLLSARPLHARARRRRL